MAIKIVRADPEIIRRVGLGAEQCAACGQVYNITELPVQRCANEQCPTNIPDEPPSYDSEMHQGGAAYNDVMFGDSGD